MTPMESSSNLKCIMTPEGMVLQEIIFFEMVFVMLKDF